MPDRTILLRPDDPAWDAWIEAAPHDFYYHAAYHRLAESMGEGHAYMVVHGGPDRFMAWPYVVRDSGSYKDANSVYGYTGPVACAADDVAFRAVAGRSIREVWRDQGLVTLFTRFHPLLCNWELCDGLHGDALPPGGEILHLGRSVSIDLAHDLETRRRLYPQVLRQEIKESERAGLVVEHDREWSSYAAFGALYRATMQQNDAADRYMFSDAYFDALRNALGSMGHLSVARFEGKPAAIMLFTVCDGIAQAHLTGVDPKLRRLSPLKGLIDGTAELARALGATRLHLGAGRGGAEDSLFAFKARFSSDRHEFKLGRWILDRGTYDALTRERGGEVQSGIFFPAYRAPIASPATAP